MSLNPGSRHFNISNGAALIDYADVPTPGTAVDSLSNNPSAVLS